MKLRTKIILLTSLPLVASLVIFMLIEFFQIKKEAFSMLSAKNRAILSRMHAARNYIASTNNLDVYFADIKKQYPNGAMPDSMKRLVMNNVPISAAWRIAQDKDSTESFEFRIAALSPRNKQNLANATEQMLLAKFKNGRDTVISHIDKASNALWEVRPVFLRETEGCLKCHGDPQNSPWGNGKDVLGYQMEDLNDGDLRAIFIIKSDLSPIDEHIRETTMQTSLVVLLLGTLVVFSGIALSKNIYNILGGEPSDVAKVVYEISEGRLNFTTEHQNCRGILRDIYNMQDQLRQIIQQITYGADGLRLSSEQISLSAQNMSDGVNHQVMDIEKMVEETSNLQAFADKSAKVAFNTEAMMEQVSESVSEAIQTASETRNAVKEIIQKIKVINEFAYSSHILALNATIESKHIGQKDTGFKAIAQEMQRLAISTKESALVIEQLSERVIKLNVRAQNSVSQTQSEVEVTVQQAKALRKTVDSQKESGQRIEDSLGGLNNETQLNATLSEELASSAEELAAQAEIFNEIISFFKLTHAQE